MSWWTSLCEFGQELASDLDQIAERVESAVHQHLTPVIQDLAEKLDHGLDGAWERLDAGARSHSQKLGDGYQRFIVRRIDPLFGQVRTEQLSEFGALEISPQEVALNRRLAMATTFLGLILLGQAIFPASLLITVPASFAVVWPIFGMARKAVQQRRITYHVVSAINVTIVWLSGHYVAAIIGGIVYNLGEKLLLITEDRSHKGLIATFSKQPRSVWLLRNGVELEYPFEAVLPGDVLVVNAGGFMPVDGTVTQGLALVDQQILTGEAQPVEKSPGDPVFASTVVLSGKVYVRVDKAGTETVAAKIGEILNRSANSQLALQSKGNQMANDAALPTLLLSGLALAVRGPVGGQAVLNSSFSISVRLSAPVVMLNLLNIASQNAILLKDGRSLERLADVDTVVFDKTGTLTLSQPNIAKVYCSPTFSEDTVLRFAAAAEHRQTHPIALAILAEASARGIMVPEIDNACYEVGYGIKVQLGAQVVQVGSDRYLRLEGIAVPPEIEEQRSACHARGHSVVMVAVDGQLAGAIELQPTIRPEAETVIGALRARGLKMVIISGDQEEPTRRLAKRLGMDRYFANVLPEGKASLVDALQAEGSSVCFIGDGINDAIALKKAHVSVSLRGATTIATDAAQIILMQESLKQLPFLFELGQDMDHGLKMGYAAGMIPGVLNVAGVFLLGWGYAQAQALAISGLVGGMATSLYPLYKHARDQVLRNEPTSEAAPPVLSAASAAD